MFIPVEVAGSSVEFRRSWWTGEATLNVSGRSVGLQSDRDFFVSFSSPLTKVWRQQVAGHELSIEKLRPRLLPAFRPHEYRVFIDGQIVYDTKGY